MNKHTPGPWIVKRSPFEVYNVDHGALTHEICSGNLMIAALYANEDGPDASLIAAAPDLLEALEALADSAPSACCVDFHHKPGDYHDADESCPALDRYEAACLSARAAIARARGEA